MMLDLMKGLIKDSNLKLAVKVSLIPIVIGIFVINLHLVDYGGIIDYNLLQVQSIYAGVMCSIFIGLAYGYFSLFDAVFKSTSTLAYALLAKIALASLFIYVLAKMDYVRTALVDTLHLVGLESTNKSAIYGGVEILVLLTGLCFVLDYLLRLKNSSRYLRLRALLFPVVIIGSLCAIIAAICIWLNDRKYAEFRDLTMFFVIPGLSYFLLKVLSREYSPWMSKTFLYGFLLSSCFFSLIFYTKGIYPFLPSSFGGGKAEFCKVYFSAAKKLGGKDNLFEAAIIHKANGTLYIQDIAAWRKNKKRVIYLIDEKDVVKIETEIR